jgi:UDP:flavonoid glycosyltransferase YjiC (YdhE family)
MKPIQISSVLAQCDLVVCNAGHGLTSNSLLHGKHVLLLPNQIEQMMLTKKLVSQHLAAGINLNEIKPHDVKVNAAIELLLNKKPFEHELNHFMAKYEKLAFSSALDKIVDLIN